MSIPRSPRRPRMPGSTITNPIRQHRVTHNYKGNNLCKNESNVNPAEFLEHKRKVYLSKNKMLIEQLSYTLRLTGEGAEEEIHNNTGRLAYWATILENGERTDKQIEGYIEGYKQDLIAIQHQMYAKN